VPGSLPERSREAKLKTTTLTVQEIHCGACETAIGKALRRADGVREVTADAASNTVTVRYDEAAIDEQQLGERLTAAGYPVVP
jgi:copper chaperone CopZ